MLDIRQRTGYPVPRRDGRAHLILISAQVQSKAGVPVLEGVTFGVFARVQGGGRRSSARRRAASGTTTSACAACAPRTRRCGSRSRELEVRLQEQRALARRAERLQALLDLQESTTLPTLAAEVIAGNPDPGHADGHDRPRHAPTACRPTWR